MSTSGEAATREPGGQPPSEEKLTPTFFIIQSLSRLEGRFDQMDRRLDDLRTDIKSEIGRLDTKSGSLDVKIASLDTKIDSVRSEIGVVVRWAVAIVFAILAAAVALVLTHA